eukprot:CAMPEP_0119528606 /NCGR_PEP_ID=MMETSP1344-20130328/42765_1 /TAXON_ID=236787 /ORGANISM="Florenciella parvula, Strain CCMP2471" /LENGTH=61 /DNA_ID=CAMNT_0007568037 /DNA_START=20 /DNA_END=205 /DNA_ORIENTATION=+
MAHALELRRLQPLHRRVGDLDLPEALPFRRQREVVRLGLVHSAHSSEDRIGDIEQAECHKD